MNSKPLISVVLPTYNRAHILEKSIRSVLQQTLTNYELLIVDDGSIDDTETVVHNIGDPRIKYIKCIENKGVSSARNIGIEKAQGKYIAFQDSDTEWCPDKLEMHMEAFLDASPDIGVVYTGVYKIKENKKRYKPSRECANGKGNGNIHQMLLERKFSIGTPAALVKKSCFELLGGFDEALRCFEDFELFLRLSKECKFMYVDKPSYTSHYTEGSLSTNKSSCMIALEIILEKYKVDFDINKKAFYSLLYTLSVWHCENDDFYKGRTYLLKSIQAYPYNLKHNAKYIITIFGKTVYKTIFKLFRQLKKAIHE